MECSLGYLHNKEGNGLFKVLVTGGGWSVVWDIYTTTREMVYLKFLSQAEISTQQGGKWFI